MSLPVEKNDRLTVHIEDLTHDGAGVAKIDGYPLFIAGALPGETAEVHVLKTLKNYGFAKMVELKEASSHRVVPPCPVFDQCGGCQMQHFDYEGQLQWKHKLVSDVMARIAKMPEVPVHPVKGMTDPWRYRNKSQIPFGYEEGRVVSGFYRPRSHSIVDTDICLIQSEEADRVMTGLKRVFDDLGVKMYDEKSHRGQVRHVIVRKARKTDDLMVVLVTKERKIAEKDAVIAAIREIVPSVTSIVQNINPSKTNVIFGDKTLTLWGKPAIVDFIGDVQFEISARSFYQVNPEQTEVLYQQALDYANLTGNETVIDAYCGIGTISLFLAKNANRVYGVEIVPQAIEDAKRNAELNGVANAEFAVGASEDVIPKWYEDGVEADVLVVDPPRKGCDEKLLATILTQRPKRVVYVSCNPGTLARDLRVLADGGYEVKEVQPVDMFPHTGHVECVTWMELKE